MFFRKNRILFAIAIKILADSESHPKSIVAHFCISVPHRVPLVAELINDEPINKRRTCLFLNNLSYVGRDINYSSATKYLV